MRRSNLNCKKDLLRIITKAVILPCFRAQQQGGSYYWAHVTNPFVAPDSRSFYLITNDSHGNISIDRQA